MLSRESQTRQPLAAAERERSEGFTTPPAPNDDDNKSHSMTLALSRDWCQHYPRSWTPIAPSNLHTLLDDCRTYITLLEAT